SAASLNVFIATDALEPPRAAASRVKVVQIPRTIARPKGARFGSLVHLLFRDAALTATRDSLHPLARTHGRLLGATEEEIDASVSTVFDALRHELFAQARESQRAHRELPIALRTETGDVFEGVIDFAFLQSGRWIVIDLKTDVDEPQRQIRYRRQVG